MKRGIVSRRDFNRYRRLIVWANNRMRTQYYKDKFNNCNGDQRKTWNCINKLLNRNSKSGIRKVLKENGECVKGVPMADHFNSYFTNVASNLVSHLPQNNNFNFLNGIDRNVSSCYFNPTNANEITNVLKSMANKGNSLFDIKPRLLHNIKDKIIPVLVFLFNFCFERGVYPTILKIGRIVPVHKSGSFLNVNNYRPITNLKTFNKIFELLIKARICSFVNRNNIISNIQFGFRESSSTSLAIFYLLKNFMTTMNKKTYTIALFLDLRKAFDVVDRRILVEKLSIYGFRGIVRSFIESYLSERTQFVTVDGFESQVSQSTHGVPQGSVLGPILFNLFINDIYRIPLADKVLFADDTVLCVSDSNFDACIDKMKNVIEYLSSWLRDNRLIANASKTQLMLITPRRIPVLPNIYFNGESLTWTQSIKYLGIIIDHRLNFNLQVNEVCKKLSRLRGVFYSLSNFLPKNVLVNLYYSLVYPTLTQNIIIWGDMTRQNYRNVYVKINKILRIVLNVKYNDNHVPLLNTNLMYKQLNFLKLKDVYRFFLLKFIHFVMFKRHDIYIDCFEAHLPVNTHNTRNNRINLPYVRTEVEKRFTVFQCCKLIRELPENLLAPQTTNSLKRNFNLHSLGNY